MAVNITCFQLNDYINISLFVPEQTDVIEFKFAFAQENTHTDLKTVEYMKPVTI